ncbi:pkd2, partial [Symbiodinium microadriaticum]
DLVILISLFHILLLFQFLVASKGQPRLALLANTLEMAFQDILHLFVVFLFIFSAFVIAGHILFGSKLRDFSTVKGAFAKSLEQVVSFKTDWDVITEQDWWTAAIWIWCMIIVVSLVVINIVLAVIFDCYGKIRAGITDQDTLWTTIRRHFTALRNMSKWYSSFDLLTGINNSKMDVITKQGFREVFRGITDEQVEQIFDLAELRAVNDTIRGQPTLLGEAIASILLGVDDMRDGIRTIQDKQFTSYKEAKIWMEELEEPLHAPDTLWDLGPATYIVTCPYGCDVRAKPDVTSELITRLAKGDKVEVVRTQDYIAGDGLRRLMGEMQDSAGYLPLFDPDT